MTVTLYSYSFIPNISNDITVIENYETVHVLVNFITVLKC